MRAGRTGTRGGELTLSVDELGLALLAGTKLAVTTYGDVPLMLDGMRIGGLMSKSALTTWLSDMEVTWSEGDEVRRAASCLAPTNHLLKLRYVDDILAVSFTLCLPCVS